MTDPRPPAHSRPGRHGMRAAPAPRRGIRLRTPAVVTAGALAAAGLAVAALAGAGIFRHGTIVVHGTEQLVVTSYDGMSTEQAFPDITGGTPVTVVNPAGAEVGSALLSPSDPTSWGPQDAVYAFVVTVPAGEQKYGIQIGRDRGTVWFTPAQMLRGPAVTLTG